jgi:hypothetical protein
MRAIRPGPTYRPEILTNVVWDRAGRAADTLLCRRRQHEFLGDPSNKRILAAENSSEKNQRPPIKSPQVYRPQEKVEYRLNE